MISEKLASAMSVQIGKEYYSGYFYMAMAAWLEENSLEGISKWMRVQGQEELAHGTIIYNYVLEAGGSVKLPAIEEPPSDYKSALDIFERGLEHEKYVTSLINNLVDIAIEEKDHASRSFLNWFVDEQVEEEANFSAILGKLKLNEQSGGAALFMIDQELATRGFVVPSPLVGKISL